MASGTQPPAALGTTPDLLASLRRSGVLAAKQVEAIRAEVLRGNYPHEPLPLARRLVKERTLTEYQARCLLHGRSEGLVVGRYVILDLIGKGGMGRVYKARHRLMGRLVALKVIAGQHLARPGAVDRFLREMRLIGRLDHPNLVRALDADQIGKVPIIVMEYVPGQTLEQRLLARGPLSPAEVLPFMAQAARGLDHAHQRGVVHRDVKPSNLLLGEDGRIRVLDLGLGVLTEVGGDDHGSFATADGIAIGTVEFMSPEQAAGRPVDRRSDLFSLGCTMYHLLSGRVPFPGDSKVECLARRIRGGPVPILDVRPGLPRELVEVLDRLMANRPEDRFQTGAEAADALDALARRPAVADPDSRTLAYDSFPAPESPTAVLTPVAPPSDPRPEVPLSPWFRVLMFLAEVPPALVATVALLALLSAFGLGYALGCLRSG
jgi:eukaryotic-like serine/threonine-protein kinase